jgi:integrase
LLLSAVRKGNRFIDSPKAFTKLLSKSGKITTLTPTTVTHKFARILKNNDIPHFCFHDLQRYSASIQHAMGIPDAYMMQRRRWQSD